MKKNVHPGVAVAIVAVALGVLVGIWIWQPWGPKPLNHPPPTREERLKFSEQMRASVMEGLKHRH